MNLPLLGDGLAMPWSDIRLILDMFLGGLGAGALLAAIVAVYYDRERYAPIVKWGSIVAPVATAIGMLLLLSELTQPARFYLALISTQASSVVGIGAWLQTVFVIVGALMAANVLGWVKLSGIGERILFATAFILAAAVAVYHGLFLAQFEARPFWHEGILTVLFPATAVATGIAGVILIAGLAGKADEVGSSIATLGRHLTIFLAGVAVLLVIEVMVLINGSLGAREGVAQLITGDLSSLFWVGVVAIGLALPLVIGLFGRLYVRAGDGAAASVSLPITAAVLALVGGFLIRYLVVLAGQGQPLLPL